MAEEVIYSHDQTITESLTCGRWTDGDMPGSRRFAIFEMDVLWLREIGTQVALYWDGTLLDDDSSWTNLHGIECAKRQAESLKVGAEDRLEVRAVATVLDRAVVALPPERWDGPNSARRYKSMDRVSIGSREELERVQDFDWDQDLPVDAWTPYSLQSSDERKVAECVVWSSKRTAEENAVALKDLQARYVLEPQP